MLVDFEEKFNNESPSEYEEVDSDLEEYEDVEEYMDTSDEEEDEDEQEVQKEYVFLLSGSNQKRKNQLRKGMFI